MSEFITGNTLAIGFIIVVFTLIPIALYALRKQAKAYEKIIAGIAERLGAQLSRSENVTSLIGEHSGFQYKILHEKISTSKHTYTNITITVRIINQIELYITKEGILDKLGQKLSITSDVVTNDEQFDKRFSIDTDTPDRAKNFLDPKRRKLISDIYRYAVTHIDIRKSYMEIRIERKSFENIDYEAIAGMLDSLVGISGEAQAPLTSPSRHPEPQYAYRKKARKKAIFIAFIVIILGLIYWTMVGDKNSAVAPKPSKQAIAPLEASGMPVHYEDNLSSFDIAFPPGWSVKKGNGKNYNLSSHSPDKDGIVIRVKDKRMKAFEHMTESELANYIKGVDSGMKRRWPDALLIDSGMTELGGEKALRTEHISYIPQQTEQDSGQFLITQGVMEP